MKLTKLYLIYLYVMFSKYSIIMLNKIRNGLYELH